MRHDAYCRDGTHITPNYAAIWTLNNNGTGCACPDGFWPRLAFRESLQLYFISLRCKTTQEAVKCPDGSDIDYSLGGPDQFRDCKVGEFKVS